jgi:hypothetical protein
LAERRVQAALLALALLLAAPSRAAADWYFTPFFGWDLNGSTTLIDWEYGGRSRTKVTFGGSVMLLKGVVGVEADYAMVPGFFENPACDGRVESADCKTGLAVITSGHVQTLTGNAVIAAPLALTRESLRPYVVAGVGWMDVVAQSAANFVPIDTDMVAFNVGGGAIGMLGNRTGLRFEVRRFINIDDDTASRMSFGRARLKFWRATVGVTLRY